MKNPRYVVGIDVGNYSVGLSAIAIDSKGRPQELLSTVSYIHDSGVDPSHSKSAMTRRAVSGVARRTRRLYRKRRRRLKKLDTFIREQGWPLEHNEEFSDPFRPWLARAELASSFIPDLEERNRHLSLALRHIARHRGWRNPYAKVSSLYSPSEPTDSFNTVKEEVEKTLGHRLAPTVTVGQMISECLVEGQRLRGEGGVLSARLQQADYAREINAICTVQQIDETLRRAIIDHVFAAESPKGSAAGRVGKDPLDPAQPRASKASDAFQRYRIAALLGNLRIRQSQGVLSPFSVDQMKRVFDFLVNYTKRTRPTWDDVAEKLGIDRGQLLGTAKMLDDGERAGAKPPIHETNFIMKYCKHKPLKHWWLGADQEARDAMIKALSNGETDDFDSPAGAAVQEFFLALDDEAQADLDQLHLPSGRAAYSEKTLERLVGVILGDGCDLYTARQAVFGVSKDWVPPAPVISEPTGNPAVDRVLKIVARWLQAVENTWGVPRVVNIEHGRAAFLTEARSREIDREIQKRTKRNQQLFEAMMTDIGITSKPRHSDLWRYQSVQRQNCKCAYCGNTITYKNCDMDHIVPRAGEGSNNRRENLVAVCTRCNKSKSNIPFALWAEASQIPGVSVEEAIDRTRMWTQDSGMSKADFDAFRYAVQQRFRRTSVDSAVDVRSAESVSWMANELRSRIAQKFRNNALPEDRRVKVRVFRGEITARARAAAGIHRDLQMIGGKGKNRLDRRHHAVDASVIALLKPKVAEVLVLRDDLKRSQELTRQVPRWKEFEGTDESTRVMFRSWKRDMRLLLGMLNSALAEDRIPVMTNLRLRLGSSEVHEATVHRFKNDKKVGDAFTLDEIDHASTGALWCALTRCEDFDPRKGLPVNPRRHIKVHGTHLGPEQAVEIFPVKAAALKVRGGYVEIGDGFHHARLYRIEGKKDTYAMMRVYTSDLVSHRHDDLFSVELPPQSLSMRYAEPKLRKAMAGGKATYVGWLVVGDELLVDIAKFQKGQVAKAKKELGEITRWRVEGFCGETQLRLRPAQLSSEGLNNDYCSEVQGIVAGKGWRPAVNQVFSKGSVVVVRRDALGRPRLESSAHLPVSFRVH